MQVTKFGTKLGIYICVHTLDDYHRRYAKVACFETMNEKSFSEFQEAVYLSNEASRTSLHTLKCDAAYGSPAQSLRYMMNILSKERVKSPRYYYTCNLRYRLPC